MSAQPESPAINIQEELPFEEAAAAERHLQAVPNLPETAEQHNLTGAELDGFIQNTNESIAAGNIPNFSRMSELMQVATTIETHEDGTYADKEGNKLNKDQVDEFMDHAEPNNWLLEGDDLEHYTKAATFKAGYELTADQKQEMSGMFVAENVPIEKQLAAYREMAKKRLALNEDLTDFNDKNKTEAQTEGQQDGIGDIVKIAKNGRGQRDGNKFISKEQMEQIESNQDKIRDGLEAWTTARENDEVNPLRPDFANFDVKGRGHREKGKFISIEQAAMIEENTEKIYNGLPELEKHRQSNSEKEAETDAKEALVCPDGIDPGAWESLTREEQDAIVEMIGETAKADEEATAEAEANPATADARGIRGRIQKLMDNGLKRIANIKNGANEYFNDEEKGKRRKVVGLVAGALVTGYAIRKGMDMTSGGAETVTPADAVAPVAPEVAPIVTETLAKGGTVWAMAREQLSGDPTNAQIFAETQRILDLNGITWNEARKLVTGSKIKI